MATKTAILNVRTDAATKRAAQSVFKRMGLDLSTGVNMYLARVAQDKECPFCLLRLVSSHQDEWAEKPLKMKRLRGK